MHGGTCLQRLWALQDLGYNVIGVESGIPSRFSPASKFAYRAWRKVFPALEGLRINHSVISMAKTIKPELVWIDKGLVIRAQTLRDLKSNSRQPLIVSFSPDDMMNPHNQSKDYLESIALYDHHITTKSYNVSELKILGAKDVIMVDNAFCRRSHIPVSLTPEQRAVRGGPVGFIGFWEQEREDFMVYLAQHGVPIRIWGAWKKNPHIPNNMRIEKELAWGRDYAATISSFDINVGFLRKINRDLQTTRSIEIPACGSFMLAERTDEHLSLFKEGEEAEFFDCKEELLEKVTYYMTHEDQRQRVAQAGYCRCIVGGYSYTERLRKVMQRILEGKNVEQ